MPVTTICQATHPQTGAVCELPSGHVQNHCGPFAHGIAQWPQAATKATCETNGHIFGHANQCVFCGTPRDVPTLAVGDIVVSKFGNRWRCEARDLANGEMVYVLRNRLEEAPDAPGTVASGPLPEWANRIDRDGLRIWERPTPRCQCPSYEKAKGPYPSGFCPDCKKWYPGMTREQAIAGGDIQ